MHLRATPRVVVVWWCVKLFLKWYYYISFLTNCKFILCSYTERVKYTIYPHRGAETCHSLLFNENRLCHPPYSRFKAIKHQIDTQQQYEYDTLVITQQRANNTLLGAIIIELYDNKVVWVDGTAYTDVGTMGIMVLPEFCHKGYGAQLMQYFYQHIMVPCLLQAKAHSHVYYSMYKTAHSLAVRHCPKHACLSEMASETLSPRELSNKLTGKV